MNADHVRCLTRISHALWGDWQASLRASEDAIRSILPLQLSDDLLVEQASKALVLRAEKTPIPTLRLAHPFYRLNPMERFLLMALHDEHWNYAKIARALGLDVSIVPSWAWAVRMKFAFQELELQTEYPRGPGSLKPSCPLYDPTQPWTEKFLDEAVDKNEQLYLQNHLMACDACRNTLERTRVLFFKIEAALPVQKEDAWVAGEEEKLLLRLNLHEHFHQPQTVTFKESIFSWLQRPSTKWLIAAFVITTMMWIARTGN